MSPRASVGSLVNNELETFPQWEMGGVTVFGVSCLDAPHHSTPFRTRVTVPSDPVTEGLEDRASP